MTKLAPYGAVPPDGGNNVYIFFHRRGFRKTRCFVCSCMVYKQDVFDHAIYHIKRGEGQFDVHATYEGFIRVTVYEDHSVRTGWLTTDTSGGPK